MNPDPGRTSTRLAHHSRRIRLPVSSPRPERLEPGLRLLQRRGSRVRPRSSSARCRSTLQPLGFGVITGLRGSSEVVFEHQKDLRTRCRQPLASHPRKKKNKNRNERRGQGFAGAICRPGSFLFQASAAEECDENKRRPSGSAEGSSAWGRQTLTFSPSPKRACSADQLHICSERQSNYLILKPDEKRPGVSWWFPTPLWKKETHSPIK